MRSPSTSANQHGGSGQKHGLQRQPEIQDELQKLEAAIGNLVSLQQPVKNDSKRPYGFKKFLGRRKNKKDASPEECLLERIKKLEQVCKDLKSDEEKKQLKGRNSEVEESMPEARDVEDSLPTNGRGVTSKDDDAARREAIVACREILSIMSSKASIEYFRSIDEGEIEESEDDADFEECATEATQDYFCGLSRIWCFAYDEDEVGTEDEIGTAEEVRTDSVTDQATSTGDNPLTPTEAVTDHSVAEVTEGDQDRYQDQDEYQDEYLLSDTETEDDEIVASACRCNFLVPLHLLTEKETSEVNENEDTNHDKTNENPDGDDSVAATPAIEDKTEEQENGHKETENCLQQRDAIVAITSCCEVGAESKEDDQGRQAVKSKDEQEEMVAAVPVNEDGSEDEDHGEANENSVDDGTENVPLGCNAFNCRHEDEAEEEYDDEDDDFVNKVLSAESTGENDSTGFLTEEEELETHEMEADAQNERGMKVEVPELQSALTLENLPKIEVVGYKTSSNRKKGLRKKTRKTKNVVKDKRIETNQMKKIAKRTQELNPSNGSKSEEFKVSKKTVSIHTQFDRKQRKKKSQDKNGSKIITKPKETSEKGTVIESTSPKNSDKLDDKKEKASSAETSEPEIHQQKNVPKKKKTHQKLMRLLMRKLSSKDSELFDVVKSDDKCLGGPCSTSLVRQATEDVTPSNSEPESVSPVSEAPNSRYSTLGSTYTPKTEQLVCNTYDMPECPITPINLHNSSLSSWTASSPNAEAEDSKEEDKNNDETTTEEDVSEETEEDLSEEEKRRKLNLFMNFLRALKSKQKNGDEDIVECLSPVLSMGGASCDTGTCNAYDDDAYINHYYDFGEDDCDSEDYFDDDDDFYDDDYYEQHDDDSFIMSIKALSKDEATMSYLKMALDIAEENNLDLNYSQITDPMIEARNDFARSKRVANDRRVTSPKSKKKSKPRHKSQKGRQREKDGVARPTNPARRDTDRQDASLVSF